MTTKQTARRTKLAEIVKTVRVTKPADVAFKVFTEGMGQWWPMSYSPAGPGADVVFEPSVGGRLMHRTKSGQDFVIGTVTDWEPPRRVAFTWTMPQWDGNTDVVVTFEESDGGTEVRLVHSGWERIGKWGPDFRSDFSAGWDEILHAYASAPTSVPPKTREPKAKSSGVLPALSLSPAVLKVLRKPPEDGVLVHLASDRGGLEASGFAEGDVVVEFAGTRVTDWDGYYRVHCSVGNEPVEFTVLRGGKRRTVRSGRSWIAAASAPLLQVRKGAPVELRPSGTAPVFDLSRIASRREATFRMNDLRGKQTGEERHVWTSDSKSVVFELESQWENYGTTHITVTEEFSVSDGSPRPRGFAVRDEVKSEERRGSRVRTKGTWQTLTPDGRVVAEAPDDAFPALAARYLPVLMQGAEGMAFQYTPLDELSGRCGLGRAVVFAGEETLTVGRRKVATRRFDHVLLGRITASAWVDDEGLVRYDERPWQLIRT
ncbi:MAG TPA: SRPBCC domain-containing protein [Actinomycetota bacterium]|nr:SRPBCC domain-containing protein [Actinomycetota bacterium]